MNSSQLQSDMRKLTVCAWVSFSSFVNWWMLALDRMEKSGAPAYLNILILVSVVSFFIYLFFVDRVAKACGRSRVIYTGLAFLSSYFGILVVWFRLWRISKKVAVTIGSKR
jgi:hypothetical protein